MSILEIIDLIVTVLCIIAYAMVVYFKVKGDLVGSVSELIALAEQSGLAGSEKMEKVVSQLSEMVPAPLKKFLPESTLQKIAQNMFDWIRRYAYNYIEAKKESDEKKAQEILFAENADTTADLLLDLMNLGFEQLAEKARANGIDVDESMSREQIIRSIILAALKKA